MPRTSNIYLILLLALILAPALSLQASDKTRINDPGAAKALLSAHRLTWQAISWIRFGTVKVVNKNGLFEISGSQTSKDKLHKVTVSGIITEVNTLSIGFKGKIVTVEPSTAQGKPCVREGEFKFFYRQQASRGWRLASIESPCAEHVDYVDIYITNHPWRPRQSKADKLSNRWGIGFIIAQGDKIPILGPKSVSPDHGLEIKYRPNGTVIAVTKQGHFGHFGLQRINTKADIVPKDKDFVALNSETKALIVRKRTDKHLMVFSRSLRQDGWLSETDLAVKGYQFISWMDYFQRYPDLAYSARGKLALNLRASADAKAKKIVTLKGDLMILRPTGKREGHWMEVAVNQYSKHPCKGGQGLVDKQYKGWIKAIDDKGFPNIWYYTHGC